MIPWDAWAREGTIGMNSEVKLSATITVQAESPSPVPVSSFRVIYMMKQEYAWPLEMASKLAEGILQCEKWNLLLRPCLFH